MRPLVTLSLGVLLLAACNTGVPVDAPTTAVQPQHNSTVTLDTRIYDVGDLVSQAGTDPNIVGVQVVELVRGTTGLSDQWDDGAHQVRYNDRQLFVTASPRDHADIEAVLAQFRAAHAAAPEAGE